MKSILRYRNGLVLWAILLVSCSILVILHSSFFYVHEDELLSSFMALQKQAMLISPRVSHVQIDLDSQPISPLSETTIQTLQPTLHALSTYETKAPKILKVSSSESNSDDIVFDMSIIAQLSSDKSIQYESHIGSTNQQIDHLKKLIQHFSSKNLILGISHNTDIKNLAIFLGSAKAMTEGSEVVLFINKPSSSKKPLSKKDVPNEQQLARKYHAHLIYYDINQLKPNFLRKYHASSLRWIFYNQLLNIPHFAEAFDRIAVVDVRDTAFQANPFDSKIIPNGEFLYAFAEESVSTIGTCGWNSGWVKDCFGDVILGQVSSRRISCSGVSIGSTLAIRHYLSIMSTILIGGNTVLGESHFPMCERNGVDQGVHNVILGLDLVKRTPLKEGKDKGQSQISIIHSLMREDNYPVTNLQHSNLVPLRSDSLNDEGFLRMRSKDSVYAIVHQYDREISIQLNYAKKYIPWVDFENPIREFKNDPTCSNFELIDGVDLFKGKCDIGSHRAIDLASCCTACALHHRQPCLAFGYVGGICWLKGGSSCQYSKELTVSLSAARNGDHRLRLSGAISAYTSA